MHLVYRFYGCQIMLRWCSRSHTIRRTDCLQVIPRAQPKVLESMIAFTGTQIPKPQDRHHSSLGTGIIFPGIVTASQHRSADQPGTGPG